MRDEKRRRGREEEIPPSKKKREDSPLGNPHSSSLKSRSHIPVSERQQFALLKRMEIKELPSDRVSTTSSNWDSIDINDRGSEVFAIASEASERRNSPHKLEYHPSSKSVTSTISSSRCLSSPQNALLPTPTGSQSQHTPHSTPPDSLLGQHLYVNHHGHHLHSNSDTTLGQQHKSRTAFSSSSSTSKSSPSTVGGSEERRRSTTVTPTAYRQSSSNEAPLMKASKKGDPVEVKYLVKEGVDINETDFTGKTALHECSARNHTRLVTYLLRHQANPNIREAKAGETPLHEAARAGHARVIRALLRHGADPDWVNNQGERPLDLAANEASVTAFRQTKLSPDHSNSSVQPFIKLFTSSKSPSSITVPWSSSVSSHHHSVVSISSSQGHRVGTVPIETEQERIKIDDNCSPASLSCQSKFEQSEIGGVRNDHSKHLRSGGDSEGSMEEDYFLQRTSPKYLDEGNRQRASTSPHFQHQNSPLSLQSARRSTEGRISDPLMILNMPNKKDPYAFDDEEQEQSPPSAVGHVNISSTASTFFETSAAVATPSCSPPSSSLRFFNTSQAGTSLPNLQICVHPHSDQSNPSSVSPSSANSIGPPLKLRIAKEAGHYTLMEHQEHLAAELQMNQNSPTEACEEPAISPSYHPQNLFAPVADNSTVGDDNTPSRDGITFEQQTPKPETGEQETLSTDLQDNVEETEVCLKVSTDDGNDTRSQKVPPLRIKLGNAPEGTPSDIMTSTNPVEATEELLTQSTSCTIATEVVHLKSESKPASTFLPLPLSDISGGASDENAKPPSSSSPKLSASSPTEELVSSDAGSETKGGEIGRSRAGNQFTARGLKAQPVKTSGEHMLKKQESEKCANVPIEPEVLRDESISDYTYLDDDSPPAVWRYSSHIKFEEASRPRSSRTLRSHTAAQREKEERQRHDVAPLKKRKYRPKAEDNNARNNMQTQNPQTIEEGGTSDTLSDAQHLDYVGPTSDQGASASPKSETTTTMEGSGADGPVEESSVREGIYSDPHGGTLTLTPIAVNTTSSVIPVKFVKNTPKVFDDPAKPSLSAWGENPYDKAAELNKGLCELIRKLVECQPKEPVGYQDYMLVTREYLLADHIPSHLTKRACPSNLVRLLSDLFEEQEDERYAQALKHQSEREQLRLCAEQSVLRAQTHATIALANQPRPLSFCSIMALKGFTYLPPLKGLEHRDEESVRDRFKARTLIGWLHDIKVNYQVEKKKLLCRQLHEAESLMMVQKLDWEVKLKELHMCDCRANIFDEIPIQYVPLIDVPTDFPLFVHEPI